MRSMETNPTMTQIPYQSMIAKAPNQTLNPGLPKTIVTHTIL
jgi:hypothetical protein